jgi:HAD superfamily hydrolase (TIGR01490 family)
VDAAFFDLDKTVIARASMVAFGKPLYREGLVRRRMLLRALYGQLVYLYLGAGEERIAAMRDSVLKVITGWDHANVTRIVRETLGEVVDPIVYDEALELIGEHRAAGRRVFLVSASPEEIVAPLARHLGVDEAIATRASLDDEGRYTGEIDFYCYGPHKAEAMRRVARTHGIDLEASYAYSDSATDLPMLEAVGHPVAVNADRELARAARERGWEQRTFVRKVRLRDRVPMPPMKATVAVAGAAIATAAGVAAASQLRRRGLGVAELRRSAASLLRGPRGRARRGGSRSSSWRRV